MKDPTTDDWLEAFGQLQVGFWVCPLGHSEHRLTPWPQGVPGATVEWRGNVAHCLAPGCTETSAP